MQPRIWIVDAFTSRVFGGNPAAVCWIEQRRGNAQQHDAWCQALAAEMRHSETAFLETRDAESGIFGLRWFTPVAEVELCGHATLAAAHVLFEHTEARHRNELHFDTLSGRLSAARADASIALDFPMKRGRPCDPIEELSEVLGLPEACTTTRSLEINAWDLLVPLAHESEVLALKPKFALMAAWPYRCVIATAPSSDAKFDFVSRVFAPRFGVDEDPVTGSAHCFLGPHWAERLGQEKLRARQASPRGGEMELLVAGDRVMLRGQAVTVLEGRLH